ncbi:MAG TPA: ribosome maturation factor RimP [Acidobacteriaceae bacterium]|nr:ribosome maturation factor RimP [Acidobacteriaceae bacterium]
MSGREPTFYLLRGFRRTTAAAYDPMALDLEKIRALADRVAASHGLAVVDAEYAGNPKHRALRIYIEKDAASRAKLAEENLAGDTELKLPENVSVDQLAGIKVEDCEAFSEDFGTVLDVEELVPGAEYTLEVSSPGLDRKLYGRDDYVRFAGSLAKLRTIEPVQGNAHWQGRITNVTDETLDLDVSPMRKRKKKTEAMAADTVTIAFSNILKANLVPEI